MTHRELFFMLKDIKDYVCITFVLDKMWLSGVMVKLWAAKFYPMGLSLRVAFSCKKMLEDGAVTKAFLQGSHLGGIGF